MKSFKVGDRVVIVKSPRPGRVGAVATVTELHVLRAEERSPWLSRFPAGKKGYCLDLKPRPGLDVVWYPGEYLEPYRDDGHEKGEWTEELRRLCRGKVNA